MWYRKKDDFAVRLKSLMLVWLLAIAFKLIFRLPTLAIKTQDFNFDLNFEF